MVHLAALLLLDDDPLIVIQKGDLPIIISAPHGGRLTVPNCPLRTNKAAPQFVTVLDTNSDKLAEETAKELEELTGKKPWLVIAKFSRKYVDANRPEKDGAESEAGTAVYRKYHEALRKAVDATRIQPGALLIDIHSQGKVSDTVFRGTGNLTSLRNKSLGPFSGAKGFLAILESRGLKVEPSIKDADQKENPAFNGGWITRSYGASAEKGIDAIQLEFGADLRSKDKLTSTAKTIAIAIKSHLENGSK
ncbi:MAG: N-formylglutamate amidohydrolase [Armatimonadota bacterium]